MTTLKMKADESGQAIIGAWHHISREHLAKHANEFGQMFARDVMPGTHKAPLKHGKEGFCGIGGGH